MIASRDADASISANSARLASGCSVIASTISSAPCSVSATVAQRVTAAVSLAPVQLASASPPSRSGPAPPASRRATAPVSRDRCRSAVSCARRAHIQAPMRAPSALLRAQPPSCPTPPLAVPRACGHRPGGTNDSLSPFRMTKLCRNIAWMLEPLPSLNGLCAFEAVVRHGSFTRAALELGITRAAVGHRIRRLEQQLGVMLLQGQQRGIVPTAAAQACLPKSMPPLQISALPPTTCGGAGLHSALTVSVTPTLAAKWLMPRLPAFKADHPGIEVRISTSMHTVDFAHEPIDLAIRYGSGVWPGLRSDPLPMTDDIYPVCSPALLRGPAPLRHPHDLAAHTLLGVHYQRGEWRDWPGGRRHSIRCLAAVAAPDA